MIAPTAEIVKFANTSSAKSRKAVLLPASKAIAALSRP
jgi:hypothetical protein